MHTTSLLLRAAVLAACLWAPAAAGDAPVPLDDAALDRVTAGSQGEALDPVALDVVRTTRTGRTVHASGTLELTGAAPGYAMYLGDGAQGNLQSLVNINAVDANVTVLLNLNINVDSSVGTLLQDNASLRAAGDAARLGLRTRPGVD